jgi:type 2 lantibiotic biosynthesis protein LanM
MNNKLFLDAAEKVGMHLSRAAFWHDNRCTWIGRAVREITPTTNTIYNKSLASDIYDGTGGIALFFSNLYRFTNKNNYREIAQSAVNQVLSKANELPDICRYSFYTGKLGLVYASAKIGYDLHEDNLIQNGMHLLNELQDNFESEHLMDVISGNASGIPALIGLYKLFKDEKTLNFAIMLGDELIRTARGESYGLSWDVRVNGIKSSSNNLTGFSHGAAGIGYALLELYRITEESRFLESAEGAFSYENHWFNKQVGNWPDFRSEGKDQRNKSIYTYALSWCHGAPGIGLSRIRAYDIIKDPQYLMDSQASLKTSTLALEERLNSNKFFDFSLCHGLSGLCETLLYASQVFGDSRYKSLAEKVGLYGIEKYEENGSTWKCGINKGGETPTLMLGLAGIGYFYLQLVDSLTIVNPLMLIENG